MALRSRFALSIAVGLLATGAAATPAMADDEWGSGSSSESNSSESQGDWGGTQGEGGGGGGGGGQGGDGGGDWGGGQGGEENASQGASQGDWGGGGQGGNQEFTRGRVTAGTLLLRSAPDRGSEVIRVVHRGDHVRIYCKTRGESVQGNRHWYLLADGTWAWGSARYIETVGRSPRWC
ncbi:SH3 domain-containing protein [Streptomyces nigra]|uniref:SH3 domain-containing protein n=1 Tax=Streptomyces nigra TaxID=1827580 RepID=UPI003683D337